MELLETDLFAHLRAHVLAICRRSEQDIDRQQQRFHAFLRPPAELAVALFEGIARPAPHGRQVLVVHRDRMIQQILLGLHKETGEHRVSLVRCEPFQCVHVIAFGQQRQVAHEARIDDPEVDSIAHQIMDLPIACDVDKDRRGARLRRIFLEPQKRRAVIAGRDLEEGVEVLT